MNRLRDIEEETKREHQNLKKSINRARTLQGILQKSEKLKDFRNEYKTILKSYEYRLTPKVWDLEVTNYEKLKLIFEECHTILDRSKILPTFKAIAKAAIICNRLSLKNQEVNVTVTTTTMPLDIKLATAIVQPYDGSPNGLDTFIDSANLLKESVDGTNLQTAIKFLRTRLTGKARLGLPDNLTTIDALIDNVKSRCEEIVTPESVLAKLKTIKQKGDIDSLCNDVDSLCSQLRATYIASGVPDNVAKKMATKAGVDALATGVTNHETRIILKAGNFTDVKQAIQKVAENANSNTNNSQILNFHTNRQFNRNRSVTNRSRGNYNSNGNYNYNDNYNSNYNNNYNNNRREFRNNDFRRQQPQERENFGRNYQRGNGSSHHPQNVQSNRNYHGRGGHNCFRRIYATNIETDQNQPQMQQQFTNSAQIPQSQPVTNNNSFLGNLASQANLGQYMH